MRKVLAVVAGLVAMGATVATVEAISHALYPPPLGLDFQDAAAIHEYIKVLPVGAFLLLLLAHFLGSFVGAVTAVKIARDNRILWPLLIGAISLLAGAANLLMIPHPTWFIIADLCMYLPAAFLGYKVVRPS